jgi:hypothetical protein
MLFAVSHSTAGSNMSLLLQLTCQLMKTKYMKTHLLHSSVTTLLFVPLLASAQGTFVYDQQSSDESNGGSSFNIIQNVQPTGQSFTPSLDGVGFIRLNIFDWNRNNGLGATLYVNLRSDSITGAVLAASAPVTLPDNFGSQTPGFVNFFFANTVPVLPGTMYFLQPVVQTGDSLGMFADSFGYPGGNEYTLGVAYSSDYWFREGVVVPEPSPAVLVCLVATLCASYRRFITAPDV